MKNFTIVLLILSNAIILAQSSSTILYSKNYKALQSDSLSTYPRPPQTEIVSDFSFLNYVGQTAGGFACGVLLAYPVAAAVGFKGANSEVEGSHALGLIGAYIVGTALGVYGIASFENSNLSFWDGLGFVGIGGGVGIGVYLSTEGKTVAAMLIGPVLGGLVYTIFFPEWEYEKIDYDYEDEQAFKIESHKDLVNFNKVSLQLLKIEF